jgi:glycosyltransferase involved in cell wall biosynthesis
MRISIVTLSFNQCVFLREALESVLSQKYPDLEYIVVDPGSTDGSRELIQSYSSEIARMIFEPDRGASDGLRKGFAVATGAIFGFLNSDDLLAPGSLQRVAEYFEANPDVGLAMGNGHIIDVEGRVVRPVKARDFSVDRYFYGGTQFLQQSTFFRREAYLNSPGFDIRNRTCWDGELFVSMVQRGTKVGYINADLSKFRIHDQSLTGTRRLQKVYYEDRKRVFHDVRGRNWRLSDSLWTLFYRGEAALRRAGIVRQREMRRNRVSE